METLPNEAVVPSHDFLTSAMPPQQKVTLKSIWDRRFASMNDGKFCRLHIISETAPLSLLDGGGWLAWVKPLPSSGHWEVGIWAHQLNNYGESRCDDAELKTTAKEIYVAVGAQKPGEWVSVTKAPEERFFPTI